MVPAPLLISSRPYPALVLALAVLIALAAPAARAQSLPVPAGDDSGMYALTTTADGAVLLSWIEPSGEDAHALKYAQLTPRGWTTPALIAAGSGWFVNWVDRPALAALPDGSLAAHWLVRSAGRTGAYGYGVRLAHTTPGAAQWVPLMDIGIDHPSDYTGFLSFIPEADGFSTVYLAPPAIAAPAAAEDATSHGHGDADLRKTLRWSRFDGGGQRVADHVLDEDVCSCCGTTAALTAEGPIVAYRDRRAGEVRDISVTRRVGGEWSAAVSVHTDGWVIAGCPTNGPVVAARNHDVVVAWFTAADDRPRVRLAFSRDAGAHFDAPLTVVDGNPIGWPGVLLLGEEEALVSWLERGADGQGHVMLRRMSARGQSGASTRVAVSSAGRATGVPQIARAGDDVIVAWRDGRVHTARVDLADVPAAGSQGAR